MVRLVIAALLAALPAFAATTDLILTKTHTGDFEKGATGRRYTLSVRNRGELATSGTVTVTDTLPAGLTATAMSGPGWSCNAATVTCTRGDSLAGGAGFPPITLTVSVAAGAPTHAVNTAAVSGGGDATPGNGSAADPTAIWSADTCPRFGAPAWFSSPTSTRDIALGDFNGDGRVDVAAAGYTSVLVRLGGGDGTLLEPADYPSRYPVAIAAGDLDRDGDLDLVTGSSEEVPHLSVLPGNGDGTFGSAVHYDATGSVMVFRVEIHDVDRDGNLDVTAFAGTTAVLLGNGDGSLRAPLTVTHAETVRGWTVADVTGDAHPDLISAGADTLLVRPGNGDGTFSASISTPLAGTVYGVTTGDFDDDGDRDVAAVAYDDAIIFIADGDGTFAAGVSYDISWAASYITTGDINADGALDLVTAGYYGHISTVLGNGDGTFASGWDYEVMAAPRIAVTELDGDGRPDLLFSTGFGGNLGILPGVCPNLPSTPASLDATATSPSQVTVSWSAAGSGRGRYEVHRSDGGGAYAPVGTTVGRVFIDDTVTANTVYLYKVRVVEDGLPGPFSNQDLTNTIAFTDDPVVPRVTRIRAVHLQELRAAVNSARTAAGMSAKTFTDPSPAGLRIRKVHVTELRAAINELREFLGVGPVAFEDSQSIQAAHITALRTALR